MSQLATDEMLTALKEAIRVDLDRRFKELKEWAKTLAPPAESTAGQSAWQQRVEDRKQRVRAFLSDYAQVCVSHHMMIEPFGNTPYVELGVRENLTEAQIYGRLKQLWVSEGIS